MANVEPLLEAANQNAALSGEITRYITDLRDEQTFLWWARLGFGALSAAMIVAIIAILALAVFHPRSPLLDAPPIAISVFIVGMVSASVFLIAGMTKSVFRSAAERHSDGFMPPQVETTAKFMDWLKGLN